MFYQNKIASRRILIGCEPFADAEVEKNQQALQQIEEPVSATFWGGTQNEDGVLTICREISAEFIGLNAPSPIPIQGSYPLEVGYTNPQKTLHYLRTGPGLARWPYGSQDIYVMHVIDGEKNGI